MREGLGRAWFTLSGALGRLLRSGRYASTGVVQRDGARRVRKRRRAYAPIVVWIGGPLMRILDTGVRVLPQEQWAEQEQRLYERLHGASVRMDADGALVLPLLSGATLAALLEDRSLDASTRRRAIELAVTALAGLHRQGVTHGDAMAENVLVDLAAGIARWFDFETVHESQRAADWRRADDLRALVATTLLRTRDDDLRATLQHMLDVYGDERVTPLLASSFTPGLHPALIFHLGQAGLSFRTFREIGRLLRERTGR